MSDPADPAAEEPLAAAYPDAAERARACRWLGLLAGQAGPDGEFGWWQAPAVAPAFAVLTVRRAALGAAAAVVIGWALWEGLLGGKASGGHATRSAGLYLLILIGVSLLGWKSAARRLRRRPTALPLRPPRPVRLHKPGPAGTAAAGSYRAERARCLRRGLAAAPAGAVLGALASWGTPLEAAIVTAHALLAAGVGASLVGPYPLVKWSELVLSAQWEEPVRFLPLLQDAVGRGVLEASGAGYAFRDEQQRDRLAAGGRAARAGLARRQAARLTGRGARAVIARRLDDKRTARGCVDAGLGVLAAVAATLVVTARPSFSPSARWVAAPVGLLVGTLAGLLGAGLAYATLTAAARAATVSLAYLPLTTRRGRLRATGVALAAAVALIALAGPWLAAAAAFVLPAALVAACGGWAAAVAWRRTRGRARRWQRAAPDLTAAAAIGFTLYLLIHHQLLTATPAAGLLFPVAGRGAYLVWRTMSGAGRRLVKAAADLVFALLLGTLLVLVLVWLANVLGMPRGELAAVRGALERTGELADLPWWAWTSAWLLLAAASLAFVRWPGRLKQAASRFERWRLVSVTEITGRALTGVHVGLLALVFVGLAGPPALTPLLSRQLRDDYTVAFQRELAARAELAAYTAITRELAFQPRPPVLVLLITRIHDVSPPADKRQASATETANARRLGEAQGLVLTRAGPPSLDAFLSQAATAAGEGGSAAKPAGLDGRAASAQQEEAAADTAAKRVEVAADTAAKVVASLIAIPQAGDNEVFQVVREYLAGLIEDSGLKDTFAAWIERLPGARQPPQPAAEVVPEPYQLEEAAVTELSAAFTAAGAADPVSDPLEDPALLSARLENPVDAAVDIVNQARYAQQRTGPCSGCTEPGVNDERPGEEPPEEHFGER